MGSAEALIFLKISSFLEARFHIFWKLQNLIAILGKYAEVQICEANIRDEYERNRNKSEQRRGSDGEGRQEKGESRPALRRTAA